MPVLHQRHTAPGEVIHHPQLPDYTSCGLVAAVLPEALVIDDEPRVQVMDPSELFERWCEEARQRLGREARRSVLADFHLGQNAERLERLFTADPT